MRKVGKNGKWRQLYKMFRRRARPTLPHALTLSARARLIWQERPDLNAAFDISTRDGEAAMLHWYVCHGFSELQLDPDTDEGHLVSLMNQSYPAVIHTGFTPITWLMYVLRDHAPADHTLNLRDGTHHDDFLAWFFARGLTDAHLEGFLTPEQAKALVAPDRDYPDTPRLLACLWRSDGHLQSLYGSPQDAHFLAWCRRNGPTVFPILSHPLLAWAPPAEKKRGRGLPFGVNLIGHVRSRGGVSEDVRAAAHVLTAANIDHVICDIHPGASMGQDDEASGHSMQNSLPYAITMLCMTAEATLLARQRLERAGFADHHVIGFWPWELPELPHIWHHAYGLVDEVWASSAFTYAAFSRSSPVPVRSMPMAVTAEETVGIGRQDFGLPDNVFLFGFAFDGLSGFARKAPDHCIEAFRRAFPKGNEPVGLIIKAMRAQDNSQWDALTQAAADDPRIHFMEQSLPRPMLLDLWRVLDCFISLHRSEGFGRNIAEAMRLGVPVICTAHSGNMDYTDHETAALVPARLKPVGVGEYPFGSKQLWAEPDLDCAVEQMRRMVEDAPWRDNLARQGRARVEQLYDVAQVAKAWTPVLHTIYASINTAASGDDISYRDTG